jgi:hypothetical protein
VLGKLDSLKFRVSALKLAVQPAFGNARDGDLAGVATFEWTGKAGTNT